MNKIIAKHLAKVAARSGEVSTAQVVMAALTPTAQGIEYEILRAQVLADVQHLKSAYPDHAERNRHKPAIIDKYREYLTDWLRQGKQHQNDVLVKVCIMAADCGDYALAITLADAGEKQVTGMSRDLRTLVADGVLQDKDQPKHALAEVFQRLDDGRWSLNRPLRRKYFVWAAKNAKEHDPVAALRYAQTADSLDSNAGVKGLIEELKLRLAGEQPTTDALLVAIPPQATGEVTGETGNLSTVPDPAADPGAPVFLLDS